MYLKCVEMVLDHPILGPEHRLTLQSQDWEHRWQTAFDMFGACPLPYCYGSEESPAPVGHS